MSRRACHVVLWLTMIAFGSPWALAQGTCTTQADCDDAEPCTVDVCNPTSQLCENDHVPGVMFGTDGSGGNLYAIDQATGAAGLIGNLGIQAVALAIDRETRVVYVGTRGADDLYSADTVTGSAFRVGSTGLGLWALEGLALDDAGTLYAAVNTIGAGNLGANKLALIDRFNGTGTIVGSFGVTDIMGLSFDAAGTLYGSSGGAAPSLYTIDPLSGAAAAVASIQDGGGSPPSAGVVSLEFDLDGTLYAGTGFGDLLELDPQTAIFTPVGSSGAAILGGLAVRDECAEVCLPPLDLYSSSWGNFFSVDQVTGRAHLIRYHDLWSPSMAIDPVTGVFYAGHGEGPVKGSGFLSTINPITGGPAFLGDAGLNGFGMVGLDFDANGTLYASINTNGPSQRGGDILAIIDKQTAAGTLIGGFGISDIGSIAFDHSGTLYGSSGGISGPQALWIIDKTTAALTLVGPIVDAGGTPPVHSVPAIEFDLAGVLYGITSRDLVGGGRLIRIDPATGVFNVVGTLENGKGLGNLAFRQTCRPACIPSSTLLASNAGTGDLYDVDPVHGVAGLLGNMGIAPRSLAIDPTTGLLYAGGGSGSDTLYRIDPATYVAIPAGTTGLGLWSIEGLDFGVGGKLYASVNTIGASSAGGDSLALLDEITGMGSIIGSFGSGLTDLGGLVFDDSGTLYGGTGVGGGAPTLYTIDLVTGAATAVGPLQDGWGAPPDGGMSGLDLDLAGVLYSSLDNGKLIRIDPTSARFSLVGNSGAAFEGMAFRHECPRDCNSDTHCDDGNPCTIESCDLGVGRCTTTLLPDSESAAGGDGGCGTADDNPALFGVDAACGTADDGVGDGLCDMIDLCPATHEPGNVDADLDGVGDACDCDPADGGAWAIPGEVIDLRAVHSGGFGGTTTFSWAEPASPGGSSVVYDTIRSDRSDLFVSPNGTCIEIDDGSDQQATDTLDPSSVLHFVVRAENGCGSGTIGAHTDGTPRPASACP